MNNTGIITGLAFEARLLAKAAARQGAHGLMPPVAVGGSPERAYEAAIRLADQGAAALLSFGLGGGLDSWLAPGDIVVASGILMNGLPPLACDRPWCDALAKAIDAGVAVVLTSPAAVASIAEKTRLHAETGARLIDMESYGVAQAAQERGLPFACLRAVADPAQRALPQAALAGMAPDGSTRPFAVIAALARRPHDVASLLRVARDSAQARRALGRVAFRHLPLLLGR